MIPDVKKARILGRLLLKLETRSRTGSGRKLIFLIISYLIPGIFLPWILARQNTDPTGFEYTFLTFLFYSLILSFTIITELDNLIISRSEAEITAALPVNNSTLVNAKMYVITRYIALLSLPLLLPGSIFYYTIMKSIPRAIGYIISGYMLSFFVINILVLLYSAALRLFRSKNIGSYTLIFQLFLILILIFGYQFISYGLTGRNGSNISSYINILKTKGIIDFFPQSWFAFLNTRNNYIPDPGLIMKLLLPLVIFYASYYSLKMYLMENYSFIKDKFMNAGIIDFNSAPGKPRFFVFQMISDLIWNLYLRNNLERSSYGLIKSLYLKDKAVRLAVLPMIIIPLGLAVFALITDQLPAPFTRNYFALKPVFHISIILCVLVVLNTAIIGVRVTNYPGVSWVYDAYPVSSRKHFKNGFRKFFVVYLLVPVCALLGFVFIFKIPFDQVIIHTLFIFSAANLYNSIYNLTVKALPFTKENTMINSLHRMTSILYPFLFGIVVIAIQLYSYKSMLTAIIAIFAFITINFWINYFGFVRIKHS